LTLSAAGFAHEAGAKSLSALVTDAVGRGADAHPLSTAAALAPAPTTPAAVAPGDPFAAWLLRADSGLDGVLRAGARSVSPGADAAPLSFEDRVGLFEPHEEWALWATDAVANQKRARALKAALRAVARDAKRAGAAEALGSERAWVDALSAGACLLYTSPSPRD